MKNETEKNLKIAQSLLVLTIAITIITTIVLIFRSFNDISSKKYEAEIITEEGTFHANIDIQPNGCLLIKEMPNCGALKNCPFLYCNKKFIIKYDY